MRTAQRLSSCICFASARRPPRPRALPGRARFPARKTLEEFDFAFQTSVRRDSILHLGQLDFLDGKENVVLLGPLGTSKTHSRSRCNLMFMLVSRRYNAPH